MNGFAVNLLKQRAERGDADAVFKLDAYFRKLLTYAENQTAALGRYRNALGMESKGASIWVARLLGSPELATFDREAALAQYQAAANAGSLAAAQEIVRDFTYAGPLQVPAPIYQAWLGKLLTAEDTTAVLYYEGNSPATSQSAARARISEWRGWISPRRPSAMCRVTSCISQAPCLVLPTSGLTSEVFPCCGS